ncbi:MAG: class I SAM-dependent methyltransferase [Burkholderiaceae bacterium]|jgi:cyclopropane fatty-acyl-phospholipid synthase-like methyltransferase|nr:class I SAM-dependent methyltransferase [Burkholderiaceae bacterium]
MKNWAVWAAGFLCAATVGAQTPHTHQHGFSGAEHWARVFDDPARDAWQKPHEVVEALQLSPDAAVADIGAGTGYFAVRLAHMTPKGRVYAVDIEPDMVKYLAERAQKSGLANLTPVLAAPDDPKLPAKVDLALMVDTYHHVGQREAYFRKLAAHLKPGGAVAIIDFTKESPVGPPPAARLTASEVKAEMQRAGYSLAREHAFLPNQYFLVFRPR